MDSTEYKLNIIGRIELPPKMAEEFIDDLRKKHLPKLAVNDASTYEYESS